MSGHMTVTSQSFAAGFRALHQRGLLVLPNAWDAGSARVIEAAGAPAIATSSAAVSWAHGYPDHQQLPVDLLVQTVREIVRVVRVPVTVDVEAGYGATPESIAPALQKVVEAGAVGVNLEDGCDPPEVLAGKIAVAKRTALAAGVDLFVNARTDVFLQGLVAPEERLRETLARARRYREAGAECLFVPGITDEQDIATVARECGLPLNVMARPTLPPPERLKALGARRLSLGVTVATAALGAVRRLVRDLLDHGDDGALHTDPIPYPEMQALFERR